MNVWSECGQQQGQGRAWSCGGHLEDCGACATTVVIYSADLQLANLITSIQ